MKILLVCMEYDYGVRSRGRSYEYYNFFESLRGAGHEIEIFDYMEALARLGKAAMNEALVARAAAMKPDVALFSLYTDQLTFEAVEAVRLHAQTLCFFHDDTWRVDFSRSWAPHFDYFTSPDFESKRKYERLGMHHSLHLPFGVNENRYKPLDVAKKYDVSFVGAWHPYREWLIKRIQKAGISVHVAGYRWPQGIVTHDEMVKIFNESRINLNLSNSTSWDIRFLAGSPRALVNRLRSKKSVEQLKARHFEINACRAFQLSYYVDGLERCYRLGEEMAIYLDPDDLVEKVKYYLSDDTLRQRMADAGYERTLAEHTYAKRFARVFSQMGQPKTFKSN